MTIDRHEVVLTVRILTDDPSPDVGTRMEYETRRALRLWLGADRVYVEQAVPA